MIFCKRCGTYSAKGTTVCPRCQADLAAFGHESMSGAVSGPRPAAPNPSSPAALPVSAVSGNYAGIGNRLFAVIIDGLLMSVATMVPLFLVFFVLLGSAPNRQSIAKLGSYLMLIAVVFIAVMLLPFVYEIVMIAKRGATYGKSFRKVVVVRTNGEPVSMGRSILRIIIKSFLSGILLIGYLMALFTEKKQALHDLIADTVVLQRD
jgi:uncharacterized RDD family membrane protein YckC